jgi:low affinity Fe/Cu permease
MPKYVAIRTCQFNQRLYQKGEELVVADDVRVPHHFALIESKAAKEIEAEAEMEKQEAQNQPTTMHDIAKRQAVVAGDTLKPKTRKGKADKVD